MKPSRIVFSLLILTVFASALFADGPVGVFAMVQKVVFEPSEQAPKKIQVWGVFVWVDGGLKAPGPINLPQRGYMYFKLPVNTADSAAAKKQWSEIKTFVGTNQIIAFGDWGNAGPFEDIYIPVTGGQEEVRVRKQNEAPAKPVTYPIRMGLVKIANDASHESLRTLMTAFLPR